MLSTAHESGGFTLTELLVSMAVLTVIVFTVGQLFNSATNVTTAGNKRMDADADARPLMDRLSIDMGQMLKRTDLDYYVKDPAATQPGNDQISFFSAVPGYYPGTGSASPLSLVAYRVSGQHQLERLGKGLVWTGVSASDMPVVFLPMTIASTWPAATNSTSDSDYEPIAKQVFRFEYHYLLRNGTLSATPWNPAAGSTGVAGFKDVAAISALVATIDQRSRVLLTSAQLSTLSDRLVDFSSSFGPGELPTRWQAALDSTTDMPRTSIAAIRIYERYIYIAPK